MKKQVLLLAFVLFLLPLSAVAGTIVTFDPSDQIYSLVPYGSGFLGAGGYNQTVPRLYDITSSGVSIQSLTLPAGQTEGYLLGLSPNGEYASLNGWGYAGVYTNGGLTGSIGPDLSLGVSQIDNNGDAAGFDAHAFVLHADGTKTYLSEPQGTTLSSAGAIGNRSGVQVVGGSVQRPGSPDEIQATVWVNGKYELLPDGGPGHGGSSVISISFDGMYVVGYDGGKMAEWKWNGTRYVQVSLSEAQSGLDSGFLRGVLPNGLAWGVSSYGATIIDPNTYQAILFSTWYDSQTGGTLGYNPYDVFAVAYNLSSGQMAASFQHSTDVALFDNHYSDLPAYPTGGGSSATPEPASCLLLGTGFAVLGLIKRRKGRV